MAQVKKLFKEKEILEDKNAIEVECEVVKPRKLWGWRAKLTLAVIKSMIILGFCWWVGQMADYTVHVATAKAQEMKEQVIEKFTITKVIAEYKEPDAATLGEIIEKVSKEKDLDPLILAVIAFKESRGGVALYRFEPAKFKELQGNKDYKKFSSDELRMISSSHGPFHVMGYSGQAYCGLQWHQLYNTWNSARCAATIVARHYKDTASIKNPGDRVREVFKRYNGSGLAAELYADDAMNQLAKVLYNRTGSTQRG